MVNHTPAEQGCIRMIPAQGFIDLLLSITHTGLEYLQGITHDYQEFLLLRRKGFDGSIGAQKIAQHLTFEGVPRFNFWPSFILSFPGVDYLRPGF